MSTSINLPVPSCKSVVLCFMFYHETLCNLYLILTHSYFAPPLLRCYDEYRYAVEEFEPHLVTLNNSSMWTIRSSDDSPIILPAKANSSGCNFRGANVLISNLRAVPGVTPQSVMHEVEIVEVDNLNINIVTQCSRYNTANAKYEITILILTN
jgi:hypothetical protein